MKSPVEAQSPRHYEHMFASIWGVEPWQIEQLRRSVAMLPPGHSVGAMSRGVGEWL